MAKRGYNRGKPTTPLIGSRYAAQRPQSLLEALTGELGPQDWDAVTIADLVPLDDDTKGPDAAL